MKKMILYISIGLLAVNIIPKGQVREAMNNTKMFYSIIKSNDASLPEVDINQVGENLSKVQKSIDDNFEMLDELENERG